MNANTKRNTYVLITLIIAALTLNPVNATTATPPAGAKIYPKFSNATSIELVGGSQITATWPASTAGNFKLWVQIPTGSNASNAIYYVYPKGNAVGNNTCTSTDPTYPCYAITVNQTTALNGWTQLTLNNFATTSWVFTQQGYVSTSANTISTKQQLGVAQVSYQSVTPAPTLTIGQTYQGGKIFYLDSTKQHGLIAAPTDQSTGISWIYFGWDITGATGTAIGTGKANTTAIVRANTIYNVPNNGAGSYAAKLCDDFVLGGYSDWYLPSKNELNELYKNKGVVGGFTSDDYWSSSEEYTYVDRFTYEAYVWYQNFYNGSQDIGQPYKLSVRCVRAF